MNKWITVFIALLMMSSTVMAGSDTFSEAQKMQIQEIVKTYLQKNPETIIESVKQFQQHEIDKMQLATQTAAFHSLGALFHDVSDPVIGNPQGKITIVEFFDYQCSHCVAMAAVLNELVKKNSDIRVVLKEFPIRGDASMNASKAALAASKQGKYRVVHDLLLQQNQNLNETIVKQIVGSSGLDLIKWKADLLSADIDQKIKANYRLAQSLKIMFTPVLFIAKTSVSTKDSPTSIQFVPGYVDAAALDKILAVVSS